MLVLIENVQPPHIPCSNLLRDAPLATTVTWYDVGVLSHFAITTVYGKRVVVTLFPYPTELFITCSMEKCIASGQGLGL